MRRNKLRLRLYERIIAIVLLMIFLKYPMYAEQQTELPPNLKEKETRLYSDSEIETLIDEISAAALEAIEQAAGEAAKAAILSVIEREAEALREAAKWKNQADINALAVKEAKRAGVKNTVIAALIGIVGGFFVGFAVNK